MSEQTPSRDASHFDRIYEKSADPWHFRNSAYEREKYRATIAALPPRRFRSALEIGCSIGELTRLLAKRCDAVHGLDIAAAPLETARQRCDDLYQVRFSQMAVPGQWPIGQYDLIVLSEVLYFLSAADIAATAARVRQALTDRGLVLLVNWLGRTDDPTPGDDAADMFIAAASPDLRVDLQQRQERYRLDRLRRE
jgi:cyclopropane fatty-acyl-phospholipid synthase-like methyltransferase